MVASKFDDGLSNALENAKNTKIENVSEKEREEMLKEMGSVYKEYGISARGMLSRKIRLEDLVKNCMGRSNKKIRNEVYELLRWFIERECPLCEWHHETGKGREYYLWVEEIKKIIEAGGIMGVFEIKKSIEERRSYVMGLVWNSERFERLSKLPEVDENHRIIVTDEEMHGKYGWFNADHKYNLPIYYSGYIVSNEVYKMYMEIDK